MVRDWEILKREKKATEYYLGIDSFMLRENKGNLLKR